MTGRVNGAKPDFSHIEWKLSGWLGSVRTLERRIERPLSWEERRRLCQRAAELLADARAYIEEHGWLSGQSGFERGFFECAETIITAERRPTKGKPKPGRLRDEIRTGLPPELLQREGEAEETIVIRRRAFDGNKDYAWNFSDPVSVDGAIALMRVRNQVYDSTVVALLAGMALDRVAGGDFTVWHDRHRDTSDPVMWAVGLAEQLLRKEAVTLSKQEKPTLECLKLMIEERSG